jgi:hypothetical protein
MLGGVDCGHAADPQQPFESVLAADDRADAFLRALE